MTTERVLIVDDNPTNLRLASFTLEKAGYDVRTAKDADEALAVLATFYPRVILMDVQLPGIDGLELTRQLRADPAMAAIRIVALTAYAMKGDEQKARAAGCDGYLTKPIAPAELRRSVAAQIAGDTEEPTS